MQHKDFHHVIVFVECIPVCYTLITYVTSALEDAADKFETHLKHVVNVSRSFEFSLNFNLDLCRASFSHTPGVVSALRERIKRTLSISKTYSDIQQNIDHVQLPLVLYADVCRRYEPIKRTHDVLKKSSHIQRNMLWHFYRGINPRIYKTMCIQK